MCYVPQGKEKRKGGYFLLFLATKACIHRRQHGKKDVCTEKTIKKMTLRLGVVVASLLFRWKKIFFVSAG